MKIGTVETARGTKAFGFLNTVETHGRFPVQIPLHIVEGRHDGPVLLVQAGLGGQEIEPAMILPRIIAELRPEQLSGTLLLVPLLNMSGFEFEQKNAIWDDKDLNTLGRGREDGTVSEQMIHFYYKEVVSKADAVIDFHTGALWGYFRYAGVYGVGNAENSCRLATATGLPHVLLDQPEDGSLACEAARDGKAVVSAWVGGGPGLRDYRHEDMARIRNALLNAMIHLEMLQGSPASIDGPVSQIRAHTFIHRPRERGLIFMDKTKRGERVGAGERLGFVKHPFTGEILGDIHAPRAGIVVHGGAAWPMPPDDVPLAILGDLITGRTTG